MTRSQRSESHTRNWLRLATGLWVGLITIAAVHAQALSTSWDAGLTASDRKDILALARDMKITRPQRVMLDSYNSSDICTIVDVEAPEVVEGNQVRTTIVKMIRPGADPARCQQRARHRRGRWLVPPANAVSVSERVRWRIHDPAGAVDLALFNVPYDDAVAIVRALRRSPMAERCPTWKDVTPQMATSIRNGAPDDKVRTLVPGVMPSRPLPPGTYYVYFEAYGAAAFTRATVGDSDVTLDCQMSGWNN